MIKFLKCAIKANLVEWPFSCGDHDYERLSDQKAENFLLYKAQLNDNQLNLLTVKENFLEELTIIL